MSKKKKSNFSQAAYEMFGVGKTEEAAEPVELHDDPASEEPVSKPVTAAPFAPVVERKATYLAAGSCMEGTMKVDGDLEVVGVFKGTLEVGGRAVIHADMEATVQAAELELVGCKLVGDCHVAGKVTVGAGSSVEGNIFAQELDCTGCIKGDARIDGRSTFRPTARMEGNVETKGISVESGAVLMGNIKM